MKVHNFSAGPAILPQTVIEQASKAVIDYNNTGLSFLEMSHRSKAFVAILEEARSLTKQLLGLGDDYTVLFLTGGASSQFFMVPMNLLNENETACYVNSGRWSDKAIKEAKHFGKVKVLASSKEDNFSYIPKEWTTPDDAKYIHLTSNNTVHGTQYHTFPDKKDALLVADMSSDIFSYQFDATQFDLIYAGAQKNLGPAGTTLVIIKKDILGKVSRTIPTMLDYQTHVKKDSAFNTPPTYPIYVCLLTLRWIQANGGVGAMEKNNKAKAQLLYDEIDRNPHFKGMVAEEDRSRMNAIFTVTDKAHEEAFLQYCAANNISGIKGHRSLGGFRASMYNALPKESVAYLVDLMKNFKPA